jgi:hypothetical protein
MSKQDKYNGGYFATHGVVVTPKINTGCMLIKKIT